MNIIHILFLKDLKKDKMILLWSMFMYLRAAVSGSWLWWGSCARFSCGLTPHAGLDQFTVPCQSVGCFPEVQRFGSGGRDKCYGGTPLDECCHCSHTAKSLEPWGAVFLTYNVHLCFPLLVGGRGRGWSCTFYEKYMKIHTTCFWKNAEKNICRILTATSWAQHG